MLVIQLQLDNLKEWTMPIKDVNNNVIQQGSKIVEKVLEPRQLTSCKLWVDGTSVYGKRVSNPSNGTALGESGSTELKDLSSSLLSLTQSSSEFRPLFQSASKSILFDGVDDKLDSGVNTFGKNVAVLECIMFAKPNILSVGISLQRQVFIVLQNIIASRFVVAFPGEVANTIAIRYGRVDGAGVYEINIPFTDTVNYNFFHFKLNWTTGVGTIRVNNTITTFALAGGTGVTSNTNSSSNVSIGTLGATVGTLGANVKHLSYYEGSTELTELEIQGIRSGILSRNQ